MDMAWPAGRPAVRHRTGGPYEPTIAPGQSPSCTLFPSLPAAHSARSSECPSAMVAPAGGFGRDRGLASGTGDPAGPDQLLSRARSRSAG